MPSTIVPAASPAAIVLLNGASCSGKTTLALALQKVLTEPHLHLCVDSLLGMLPEHCRDWQKSANQRAAQRAMAALPRCADALATAGNPVILDATLTSADQLYEYVYLLSHLRVTFVGVLCETAELERRARKRGERSLEVVQAQVRQVHAHGIYDLQVDATQALPLKLAEQVRAHLERHRQPTAFPRLRSERLGFRSAEPTIV